MKHLKFIISLSLLLGLASLAEAQIVVTSTTASTKHIGVVNSGRTEGFVIRPDLEIGAGNEAVFALFLHGTLGYQFNPFFFVGGGLGWDYDFSGKAAVPLFVNLRAYLNDKKWSPFFDLKLGRNIPTTVEDSYYSSYETRHYKMTGLKASGTFGMQYQNIDFGLSLVAYNCLGEYEYWDELYNTTHYTSDPYFAYAVMLNIAYNFQFKQ